MKRATGSPVYYTALSEDGVVTEEEAEEIDVLKEVFMIGYPAGVSSAPMEYPILRLGVLASAPCDNYANNGGYVDINAVGGSSGSPLFLIDGKVKLIGVINAAVMDNPLSSANLGVYIDAYKLLEVNVKEE